MKIEKLDVAVDGGYIECRSGFYTVHDGFGRETTYTFFPGLNKMQGEIDSGVWAISYFLSMRGRRPKDFILFDNPVIFVNGDQMSINELEKYSCYMDKINPLFARKKSVREMVSIGLKKSGLSHAPEEIRELFCIEPYRFEQHLEGTGNERFKAMAAIAYCHQKQIFCFPWMSQKRYDAFHLHLSWLVDKLAEMRMIVILPIGF